MRIDRPALLSRMRPAGDRDGCGILSAKLKLQASSSAAAHSSGNKDFQSGSGNGRLGSDSSFRDSCCRTAEGRHGTAGSNGPKSPSRSKVRSDRSVPPAANGPGEAFRQSTRACKDVDNRICWQEFTAHPKRTRARQAIASRERKNRPSCHDGRSCQGNPIEDDGRDRRPRHETGADPAPRAAPCRTADWLHVRRLPGKPDVVLTRFKAAILVHGCFWHRHKGCRRCSNPSSNVEYWTTKFQENVKRASKCEGLSQLGWRVAWVWECHSCRRPSETVAEVIDWLHSESDSSRPLSKFRRLVPPRLISASIPIPGSADALTLP